MSPECLTMMMKNGTLPMVTIWIFKKHNENLKNIAKSIYFKIIIHKFKMLRFVLIIVLTTYNYLVWQVCAWCRWRTSRTARTARSRAWRRARRWRTTCACRTCCAAATPGTPPSAATRRPTWPRSAGEVATYITYLGGRRWSLTIRWPERSFALSVP